MTTDYNTIAQEYKASKQQPWRLHVEHFTLFELIGDLTGKSVLDLACGEGFYTRFLKQKGAGRTLGVDISERMIELGRKEEARKPMGIDYLVQDVKKLNLNETFDLAVAGYLLNYAATREELLEMCQAIARSLKPGGRFVTVNNNPLQPPERYGLSKKYGFIKILEGAFREGAPIVYRFFLDNGAFEITNYQLSVATHEWAFKTAGLRDIRWHEARLSPAGEKESGKDYWQDMIVQSPIICIECRK